MTRPSERDLAEWLEATARQVRSAGNRKVAQLRRQFDASLERVWAAFTDRDQLERWFGRVSGDFQQGATVTIDVGAGCNLTSQILECVPPHRLRITWCHGTQVDEVELRLAPDGDGTRIELEHRSDSDGAWWLGAGSGWEYALIKMSVLLSGGEPAGVPASELDPKLGPLWSAAGASAESKRAS